jgi:hypothetical protein
MSAFTDADLCYLLSTYFTLEELCAGRDEDPVSARLVISEGLMPRPSYVLDDGTELFPADYFVLVDQAGGLEQLRGHFQQRYRAAGGDEAESDSDWRAYLDGTYGICLRVVAPETIVRKSRVVESLTDLLAEPAPERDDWGAQLRREVWELDALERDFAPDYDRSDRFDQPPSRDLLIAAARERHPEVFAR